MYGGNAGNGVFRWLPTIINLVARDVRRRCGNEDGQRVYESRIPVSASNALTDVLREGARRMLREAVEADVQAFLISPCLKWIRHAY